MKKQRALSYWLNSHFRAIRFAYHELIRTPLSTGLTIGIIAIAITLPLILAITLKNLGFLYQRWQAGVPTISLYLRPGTTESNARDFINTLKTNKQIASVTYISPEQALTEFKQNTQLDDVLDAFDKNPLPGVVVVLPAPAYQTPMNINLLFDDIKRSPLVDTAQLDINWVKRLYSLINIGKQITHILIPFFAAAVLLIIGNTLRAIAQNHQQEIEILTLMGATDGFIQRPLRYCGIFYALSGSVVATCLTNFFVWLLQEPVLDFARSYQTTMRLQELSLTDSAQIIFLCILLSSVGTWLMVRRLLSGQPQR